MEINYSFKGKFGFNGDKDSGSKTVKGFKKLFAKKEDDSSDEKPSVKSDQIFKNDSLGFGGNWILSGSVKLTVDELKELDRDYRDQIKNGDILETAKQTGAAGKILTSSICEAFTENADSVYNKIAEIRARYEEDDHGSSVKMAEFNAELSKLTHEQHMADKEYTAEERKLDKKLAKELDKLDKEE